jgi:hypothetical protein
LNVLKKKRRSPKIVDWTVEKSLNFFLMQIHSDEMIQSRAAHHLSNELGHNASSLAHLTCGRGLRIGGNGIKEEKKFDVKLNSLKSWTRTTRVNQNTKQTKKTNKDT